MKKRKDREKYLRHQRKREYSNYKRKGKEFHSERYFEELNNKRIITEKILAKRKPNIIHFLESKIDFDKIGVSKQIVFPKQFSLSKNYDESILFIYRAIYSYHFLKDSELVLSFKRCEVIEICCLFLLDISMDEVFRYYKKLQDKLDIEILNTLKVVESDSEKVNKKLVFLQEKFLTKDFINDLSLVPIFKFFEDGSKQKKSYHENKKSITTKKITEFLDEKIADSTNFMLSPNGVNQFQSIIGEIIDNSEQHSYHTGNWFVGVLFSEDLDTEVGDKVMETQLHFLNFGATINESFLKTKDKNAEQYAVIDNIIQKVLTQTSKFNYENLITLLSLNQSVSSLYYEEEARGTGTINFLNSFFDIGDFVDDKRGLFPEMLILSGNSIIRIDTRYKPYINEKGKYNISLNDSQRIDEPPDESHLKKLKEFFPGTLISMRVYLNRNHLKGKMNDE